MVITKYSKNDGNVESPGVGVLSRFRGNFLNARCCSMNTSGHIRLFLRYSREGVRCVEAALVLPEHEGDGKAGSW